MTTPEIPVIFEPIGNSFIRCNPPYHEQTGSCQFKLFKKILGFTYKRYPTKGIGDVAPGVCTKEGSFRKICYLEMDEIVEIDHLKT